MRAGPFAFWMNLPAVVCLVVVLAYPIGYAAYLSVHDVSSRSLRSGDMPWAESGNFERLFEDAVFWLSLRHTVDASSFSPS